MSSLRAPGLGPIIGHTTTNSCRLWIRAGDPGDEGASLSSERRTVGVLTVLKKNDAEIAEPPVFYFRLRREYDRTGSFDLGQERGLGERGEVYPLDADSKYHVRIGTLTIDDPFSDDEIVESDDLVDRLPSPEIWRQELENLPAKKSEAVLRTFRVAAEAPLDQLSFIVGSCRYPGLLWKVKQADQIFRPLREEVRAEVDGMPVSFVLMVGDQIYADMLNRHIPIGLADTYEEFQDRYLKAFGSTNMRKLLRLVPTYMILDDHEIEDNWSQDRIRKSEKRRLFNLAIGAYMSYQWSHGPRDFDNRLFCRFDCDGYPFFVLDTRTQRYMDDIEDSLDDNHLLGRPSLDSDEPNQLDHLLAWLETEQNESGNVPKFIVSSSVFVPNPMLARAGSSPKRMEQTDSWPGFPQTRKALLDRIVEQEIQNVVFVSGDIHCSNVAEMDFSGSDAAAAIKAFAITSSAFYWPFWFADGEPSHYVHDSRKPGQSDPFSLSGGVEMNYRAWNFTQKDNYCRIDVDKANHAVTVRAFDTKGELIEEKTASGAKRQMLARLDLAPW